MTREEIRELAALYALGGLEAAAPRALRGAPARRRPRGRFGARRVRGALADLAAATSEPPPPGVKPALRSPWRRPRPLAVDRRDRCRVSPPRHLAHGAGPGHGRRARRHRRRPVGLRDLRETPRRLGRDAEQLKADIEHQQTVITILRDPATEIVALAGQVPAPTARARMLWHRGPAGLRRRRAARGARGQGLSTLGHRGKQRPDLGRHLLRRRRQGRAASRFPRCRASDGHVFAVTLEPAGGLPAPTGEVYLLGKS